MASGEDLSDCLQKLSFNHENVLSDIVNNYECIFSWDIYEKINLRKNIPILEKLTQKLELILENKNIFDFNR